MKTRYTTVNDEHIVIDDKDYTFEWEFENVTEFGKYIRVKFLGNIKGEQRLTLDVQPATEYSKDRTITSSAISQIQDWWKHTHVFDLLGEYTFDNWVMDGMFCVCGLRQGQNFIAERNNDVPKQLTPFEIIKVASEKNSQKLTPYVPSDVKDLIKPKSNPLQKPLVESSRREVTIPKDSPIALSIHDKQ